MIWFNILKIDPIGWIIGPMDYHSIMGWIAKPQIHFFGTEKEVIEEAKKIGRRIPLMDRWPIGYRKADNIDKGRVLTQDELEVHRAVGVFNPPLADWEKYVPEFAQQLKDEEE